jgi:hypothetical protein
MNLGIGQPWTLFIFEQFEKHSGSLQIEVYSASWQCSTGNLACWQSWLDKVEKLSVD